MVSARRITAALAASGVCSNIETPGGRKIHARPGCGVVAVDVQLGTCPPCSANPRPVVNLLLCDTAMQGRAPDDSASAVGFKQSDLHVIDPPAVAHDADKSGEVDRLPVVPNVRTSC